MATIKSYTDLEQSKKLAQILSHESADMYYFLDPTPAGNIYHIVIPQIDFGTKTREPEYNKGDIPCWSLMALLSVIPKCIGDYNIFRIDINDIDTSIWYDKIGYGVCNELPDITMKEPVDACVEMIEKLKEKDLL